MNTEELKVAVAALKPLTVKFKPDLVEALKAIYPDHPTKEAACLFFLDMADTPKCRVCGNKVPFYPLAKATIKANIGGWNDVCSHKCSGVKNKETCLKKYGTTHHLKSDSTSGSLEKRIETNMEKYGVAHVLQNKDINQKMQSGIRERNNGHHFMDFDSQSGVQEKIRETNMEKYGVQYFFQHDEFQEKSTKTHMERYGVRYPSQSKEIRQKTIETSRLLYGVDNVFQSPEIIEQMAKNRYAKEAEEHPNENARRFYANLLDFGDAVALEYELNQIKNSGGVDNSLIGIARHTGIPLSHINSILVKNQHLKSYINYDTRMTSSYERDICARFETEEIGVFVSRNDRRVIYPKELDCVFPMKKVAVEINGIYYHSETRGGKDSSYHVGKTDACLEAGYRLYHFTDMQIEQKKEIVISMISNAISRNKDRVYARKTSVKSVDRRVAADFFNANHIDGNAKFALAYGLYVGDELVMCMSIDRPRNGHDKSSEYEIIRVATKLYMTVVGGFSKLFDHFIKDMTPTSVLSYQDKRYGGTESKSYASRMELVRTTDPSWDGVNIKTGDVRHRMWFTKNRLRKMLRKRFDDTKSIKQNMLDNGYDRIWNCGHYVWRYDSQK